MAAPVRDPSQVGKSSTSRLSPNIYLGKIALSFDARVPLAALPQINATSFA
jgi:hypothetical protein